MKKFRTRCTCLFAGMALITQIACKRDKKNDNPGPGQDNRYVNDWILENMKDYYYWNDKLPANPDKSLSPDGFFYSLLKKPEDRYSWIQDNYQELLASLSGVTKESGIDYDLFLVAGANNSAYLAGIVQYVKKGSPAEAAGVKRGDVFVQINGQPFPYNGRQAEVNRFVEALGKPHTLGIHKVLTSASGKDSLSDPRPVQLQVVELAENPVYLDTVYTIDGQKIGYFVYNFFAPDKGDESASYDKQVDAVFARFKAAGIQHLVLDFRYNPGGDSRSTLNLASNIVKGLEPGKEFYHRKMNPAMEAAFKAEFGADALITKFSDEAGNVGNQLNNFIILTSSGTASASELIINGLKPYMGVYLIGDTTEGKNLGSISIYEEKDPKNKWGMQPIVSQAFNSLNQSDYSDGFIPDEKYEETLHIGVLGDVREPLLSRALTRILGHAPARKTEAAPAGSRTVIRKVGTSRSFKAYSGRLIEQLPKK